MASPHTPPNTLTRLRVQGFKSLEDVTVQVRPLTILAGANSSGKSSAMQPLLLIKQTLESSYQTGGTLLLNGPNARFTEASQVLSLTSQGNNPGFSVGVEDHSGLSSRFDYIATNEHDLKLSGVFVTGDLSLPPMLITPETEWSEIENASMELQPLTRRLPHQQIQNVSNARSAAFNVQVPDRYSMNISFGIQMDRLLASLYHLPGLRGLPERTYPTASRTGPYKGTFEPYTASVISGWQQSEPQKLRDLEQALRKLGLTRFVEARTRNATEIELRIGRLPVNSRGEDDLVNVADVGFGVSQVLPIVVALLEAEPGQVVYVEQPELHLHPRAQQALAGLLAEAAKRGVRVIAETHSSILLLSLQTLVAQGKLAPDLVALHWFQRNTRGVTKVTFAELDESGAFGDWPEDFGDVELGVQRAYLDAVARRSAAG